MPDDERREQGPSAATGSGGISRRSFPAGRRIGWRRGRPAVLGQVRRRAAGVAPGRRCRGEELAYASIADLQAALASGRLTATRLTQIYLRRIRQIDRQLGLNSVLESDAMGTRAGSLALAAAGLDRGGAAARGGRDPRQGEPEPGAQGIDAALAAHGLAALLPPTNSSAWPTDLITGDWGSAWSEPTLIRLASGFEAAANVLRRPAFQPTFTDGEGAARRARRPRAQAKAGTLALAVAREGAGGPAAGKLMRELHGHRHERVRGLPRPKYL